MNDEKTPAILIFWDEQKQGVAIQWDNKQIRNPAFVLAVLDQAKVAVDQQLKLMAVQQHQARMAEQMQGQAIAARVLQGR